MGCGRDLAALSPRGVWAVRLLALGVGAAVLWGFGPRAGRVLAAGLVPAPPGGSAPAGRRTVALDRIGFALAPAWLQRPHVVALLLDLEPRLRGPGGGVGLDILDRTGTGALEAALLDSPWVRGVSLERRFPDRLRVSLYLREPLLEVRRRGEEDGCLTVDAKGICLPPVPGAELPFTVLDGAWSPGTPVTAQYGRPHPDPRVRAAAEVVCEWREQIAPRVTGAPSLVEVDAWNLGERRCVGARYPDIQVVLRRGDGGTAPFAYGRPPTTDRSRVPIGVKIEVLTRILAAYPGLVGLEGGDLRLANRWRDWLLPSSGRDPVPR